MRTSFTFSIAIARGGYRRGRNPLSANGIVARSSSHSLIRLALGARFSAFARSEAQIDDEMSQIAELTPAHIADLDINRIV
jgi:hypothetical protein